MFQGGKLRNMASLYLLRGQDILLLYRQGNSIVHNLWVGSAGGHFEKDELNDATACVLRELQEELSLNTEHLENLVLRYITLRSTGNEIRQNYYFFANLKESVPQDLTSTEGISKWFPLNDLDDLPMPFTARHVIDHYIRTGQYDDQLYGGIANEIGVTFIKL